MRKLLLAVGLTFMAAFVLASAANAQSFFDPNAQVGDSCPPGLAPFGDPGTGLTCLSPEDVEALEVGTLEQPPTFGAADGICVGPGEGDPDCAAALLESLQGTSVAPETAEPETVYETPSEAYTVLPDTGGLPLVPLAALIVGAGIVGARLIRS